MKKNLILSFLCLLTINVFAQNSVMDFFDAKVKPLNGFTGKPESFYFKKKDIANDFLFYQFNDNTGNWEEMAYYSAKNGKKFVAVSGFSCYPWCGNTYIQFFELQKNSLNDQTQAYLTPKMDKQISEAISEKEGKLLFKLGTAVKLTRWVKLPQIGTTIKIGLQEFGDEKYTFHLACELEFNATNGTFQFVKK